MGESAEPGQPSSTGLSAQAQSVLARWNPRGLRQLDADGVYVAGPPRSGKSAIEDELRRLLGTVEVDAHSTGRIDIVTDPASASVVLMVFDASAPLGREDLAVLDAHSPDNAASARSVDVVFALNKIDVHQDWLAVAGRNAELLARHDAAFGDAVIYPVSAREGAGVDELLSVVVTAATRRRTRRQQVEDTQILLAQTKEMIADTIRRVRDETEQGALRSERSKVAAGRDGGRAERVTALRSQIQLAKVALLQEVASLVRTATRTSRTDIDKANRKELASYPQRLAEQSAQQTTFIADLVERRIADLAHSVGLAVTPVAAAPSMPTVADFDEPDKRRRGLEDQMAILLGASAGLGLGRLVVSPLNMVPALNIATIPVTLLLGASVAWWLMRARGHLADRAHTRQWASESVAHVRGVWEQIVLSRLLEAESQLGEQVIAQSRAHAAQVDSRIAAIDVDLRRLNSQRAGKLASCERDLDVLDAAAAQLGSDDVRHTGGEN